MGTYGTLEAAGPVLDALGDPTRRVILETLRLGGPSSVSVLADQVPVSRPAISQHLKVLAAVGLVRHESRGTRNIYRIHRAGLDELRDWLDQFWGDATAAPTITPTTTPNSPPPSTTKICRAARRRVR